MTIVDNLDFILKQKKITKRDFAAKLGVSSQNLHVITHGNITLKNIEKIANALNVKPAELLADPPLSTRGFFRERAEETHTTIKCPICGATLNLTLKD